jgi:hypothetical protein
MPESTPCGRIVSGLRMSFFMKRALIREIKKVKSSENMIKPEKEG